MTRHCEDLDPIIRRLWGPDLEAIQAHFLRLDPDTRQARFAGHLNDAAVARYAQNILRLDSLVYGAFVDGRLRAVAELRGLFNGWPATAEAAFSVESNWQNRGIGEALFDHILAVAQNRGVRTLYMICLRENERMTHLARKHDARLHHEPGAIEATLAPHWPTPMSLFDEAFRESRGFACAILQWPDGRS